MFDSKKVEIQWGGKTLTLETGRVARQADGAVLATLGETVVLCAVTAAKSVKEGQDFTLTGSFSAVAGITTDVSGIAASATVAANASANKHVKDLDISSFTGSQQALEIVDKALTAVNSSRADMGAIQNRFSSTISNLATTSENLSASRSRIRDTDYAKETAELTRTQILQQAGTAMVAQANQLPQQVLKLLQG